jgi:hypothetical protein
MERARTLGSEEEEEEFVMNEAFSIRGVGMRGPA